MLSIVLVLGIRIIVRIRNFWKNAAQVHKNDNEYARGNITVLGVWILKERKNGTDLIEVFKMYRGLSNVLLHELFTLDENNRLRVQGGARADWLRPAALGILPTRPISFQIKLLTNEFAGPADG